MAGINVPLYKLYKLNTSKLRNANWNLTITEKEADLLLETVSLFEGQDFRLIADILDRDIREINFLDYMMIVVVDNVKDFRRVTRHDGITVNGHNFRRFVGTSSGLKNNSLIFVNSEVIDKLNRRCECGRKIIKILPAKLETYKALTHSASQPICDPRGILVVHDCITHIVADVISIDDGDGAEPVVQEVRGKALENTVSDGFNLCTIGYMEKVAESLGIDYTPSGVCLRNAWLKGMLYPFPIVEFCEKYNNGNYIVEDIWGHKKDLREIEMILTESTLKLWEAYDSIEDYVAAYHNSGYSFAVTKISPHKLEDERELNYQYLQSYDFDDKDIEELCAPTVNYLKDAHCGDYKSTVRFLGIAGGANAEYNTWQKALYASEYMLQDPYVIDQVHKMIKNKIDEAKIGKLLVHGNYQIASGDPFALMQSICDLSITGLLQSGQIYSKYWNDEDIDDVVVFRSPMTSHNNICRCKVVNNEDVSYWYQYMDTIMILNGFDTMCQSLNGCD